MRPLGMYAFFGFDLPLQERLKSIKRAGFDTTFLWFEHEGAMMHNGRADDMPKMVRDAGLILDNIHAPFWDHHLMWTGSPEAVAKVRQEIGSTLSFCGKHHIPRIVAHLCGGDFPPHNETGLHVIRDLVKQAEDLGVTIAIENMDGGTEYMDFIFSNIQSPNLRFCYDSSHDFIVIPLRRKALEKWGRFLVTTHLSDNFGTDDDHLLPGRGTIDWSEVREHFPKKEYEGALMLEVDGPNSAKGFTPEQFLKTGYEWLRQFQRDLQVM